MSSTRLALLFVLTFVGFPCLVGGADTSLVMTSDPGDYIGGGQTYAFAEGDGVFTAVQNEKRGVDIFFHTPGYSQIWTLRFSAPGSAPLRVQAYEDAVRFVTTQPRQTGLDVYGNGRGANMLTGRFEVKKIAYRADGTIESFWATFEQHAEGWTPALRGEIKIRADSTVASVNQPPGVHAGLAQRFAFPAEATLDAFADDDGLPTPAPLMTTWEKASGPGQVIFANASALQTTAAFSAPGIYVLRLTASDGALSTSNDVTINAYDPNEDSFLVMGSEPGDYIGAGQTYFFDIHAGDFTATRDPFDGSVEVIFRTPLNTTPWHAWSLRFAAPDDVPLTPGTYLGATRWPFNGPGVPGIAVFGDGRGDSVAGDFVVKEIVFGPGNTVESFWATFEQHSGEPALYGEIRFHSGGLDKPVNRSPIVSTGENHTAPLMTNYTLPGSVVDDGLPAGSALTAKWQVRQGPGTVVFADDTLPGTTAIFSAPGNYVLELRAFDGLLGHGDRVVITVVDPAVETSLTLTSDPGDPVGQGGTYTYGPDSGTYEVFRRGDGGVQVRFRTESFGEYWWLDFVGPAQAPLHVGTYSATTLTDSIYEVRREPGLRVYGRHGSASPITGSFEVKKAVLGPSGEVYSFWVTFEQHADGGIPALRGEFKYRADSLAVPANQKPGVLAGPDQRLAFPSAVPLSGFADDDGLPASPGLTTQWSVVSGPGTVTFGDATAQTTEATFSAPGAYVLRLTANDGEMTDTDDVRIAIIDPAEQTSLRMVSEPGDPIGGGETFNLTLFEGDFVAMRNFDNGVTVQFDGPASFDDWSLIFAAPHSVPLTPGTYLGARRFPFQADKEPGLDISGRGIGPNQLTGSFIVKQAVYDAGGAVQKFWAVFEQRNEGSPGVLRGEIRFRADVPVEDMVVEAGADTAVAAGGTLSLLGRVASSIGLPVDITDVAWSLVSGPAPVDFSSPEQLGTEALFPVAGNYVLELAVTSQGTTVTDQIYIFAHPPIGTWVGLAPPGTSPTGVDSVRVSIRPGGLFTARVTLETESIVLRGSLRGGTQWSGGRRLADGTTLHAVLELAADGMSLSATFARGGRAQTIVANPQRAGIPEASPGRYGFYFRVEGGIDHCRGTGWALGQLRTNGIFSLAGQLPDGTPFAGRQSINGTTLPVAIRLGNDRGRISGDLQGNNDRGEFNGELTWTRAVSQNQAQITYGVVRASGHFFPPLWAACNALTGTNAPVLADFAAGTEPPEEHGLLVNPGGTAAFVSQGASTARFTLGTDGIFRGRLAGGEKYSGLMLYPLHSGQGTTRSVPSMPVRIVPNAAR